MPRRPITLGQQANVASVPPYYGFEAATQTYKEGAVLVASSNRLAEGGTDPFPIFGIAGQAALGVTGSIMPYFPALPSIIFEGSIDDSSNLDAGTLLASDFGASYGITKDSAGFWYLDKAKTNERTRATIIGFRDPVGVVQGRVYFTFG